VVWVFTGILHIGLEEIYKFVFLHVEILFFLSGAYICSFTFTVEFLWVRKILLNFRGAKRTLFLHLKRKKTWNSRLFCTYISLVFNTCSSSILLPILPFGIGLCSFVLFSDVSRNSRITKRASWYLACLTKWLLQLHVSHIITLKYSWQFVLLLLVQLHV